jgi:serine/threonine protein kinase/Tol biopolymer transport system component
MPGSYAIIPHRMSLAPGTRLGPYEVVEKIGAGGMGDVYLGRDSRLGRNVAVKVLPDAVARDAERRARFEREARAIASLEHPHVCRLYDVGAESGVAYLVMELLEGKTLAGRLFAGALPLAEALEIGIQLADALAAAHRRGIVHRDLKPANVVLTAIGPKLLDFGIAQLPAPAGDGTLTEAGQVVGTPHYMAPEQLLGKPVDARADVFALGCLLFEMLAGRRAFTTTSLHEPTPSLREAAPPIPPALERLVTTCLSVDREDRWSSAHDVKLQLAGILEDHELGTTPKAPEIPIRTRRGSRLPWVVAAVAVVAALTLAGLPYVPSLQRLLPLGAGAAAAVRGTPSGLSVLSVQPPLGITPVPGEAPQISPDGRTLAFVAADASGKGQLYLRRLDSLEARPLPGTEGALLPFWSPDSQQLGYFAGGQLWTVAVAGGAPHALAEAPVPRGGAWGADGHILFTGQPNQPPSVVPASGGKPARVPTPAGAERAFRWFPTFLPDGRHYLYTGYVSATERRLVVRMGSLDGPETVDVLPAATGSVRFAAPGWLLFRRESTLVAQRFDPRTGSVSGAPVALAEEVGANPITWQALFSVSDSGVLAYAGTAPVAELAWFDRGGNRLEEAAAAGGYNALCLRPGNGGIVFDQADPATANVDLWTLGPGGGEPARLTFDRAVDMYPVCAPDGQEVVFASLRQGSPRLFRVDVTRPGSEQMIRESTKPTVPSDISRDGKLVLYAELDPVTHWDLAAVPLAGGEPIPIAVSEADERQGRLSPDGRFVAYVSNETGTFEVYVRLWAPDGADGPRWQISKGGGLQPHWRADSGELYYVSADRRLIGVQVKSARQRGADGPDFATGDTVPLGPARIASWERDSQGGQYAASPDGTRFLVSTATDASVPLTVMVGWAAAAGN